MAHMLTGIELTERVCKIVQVQAHKDERTLTGLCRADFPPVPEGAAREEVIQQRAGLIRAALRAAGIRIKNAHLTLPKHFAIVRYIVLPSTEDEELKQMAKFETDRHLPFNVERHITHFHVMRKEGLSGSHCLLAAIDTPPVQEALTLFKGLGIHIDRVSVSSLTSVNALEQSFKDRMSERCYGILNLGVSTVDITMINKGLVIFTRSFSCGLDRLPEEILPSSTVGQNDLIERVSALNLLEPERSRAWSAGNPRPVASEQETASAVEGAQDASTPAAQANSDGLRQWGLRLVAELRRSYEFARREFSSPPVEEMLICGDGACLGEIAPFLEVNTGQKVTVMDPFAGMTVDKGTEAKASREGPCYAVAFGCLAADFVPGASSIHLSPADVQKERATKLRRQSFLVTGAMGGAVLVLALLTAHRFISGRDQLLAAYEEQITEMKPVVESLMDQETKYKIIRRELGDRASALAILNTISGLPYVPDKVAVTEFDYKKNEELLISGHARDLRDLHTFINDLEKTGFFDAVEIKQHTPYDFAYRTIPNTEVYQFVIRCTFLGQRSAPEMS
ncbi:MAG: pilus assembly protein PilM [bacterium]